MLDEKYRSMSSDEENLEEIYDKMFSYRYTDDDPEYVKTCSIGIPPGACVANYFNRPKRNYDKNPADRDRGGRDRWRGGHQGDRGYNQGQGHYQQGQRPGYHDNRGNYDRDRSGGRDNRGYRGRDRYQPY